MLISSLNRFNHDQREIVDHRDERTINFNVCIGYCDLCASSTPGCVEYIKLICVLCDGVGYMLQAVNVLLLRLHKATCLLLHHKPVITNEGHLLPDILNDIMKTPRNMCGVGPDIVPASCRSLTNYSSSTQQSNFLIRAHTSHERLPSSSADCSSNVTDNPSRLTNSFNITQQSNFPIAAQSTQQSNFPIAAQSNHQSHKYDIPHYNDFVTSDQHNTRNTCLNCDNHSVGTVSRQGQNSNALAENNGDLSATTNEYALSQNSAKSSKTVSKLSLNYRKSDHTSHRKFHISSRISSNHKSHEINKLNQTCMVPSSQPHQILPSSQPHQILPSSQSQKNLPSSQSHQILPSSQSQKNLPSSQSHQILPSSQSHQILPSSQSHQILPSSQLHQILPSSQSHQILPSSTSQQILPSSISHHILPSSQSYQILPSCRSHPRDMMRSQDTIPELQTSTQHHGAHNFDSEFTREIVLALRNVGDNINGRMRFDNELSLQAVFGTSKISARWMIAATLKQYNAVGVLAGVCLELLQQFNRL